MLHNAQFVSRIKTILATGFLVFSLNGALHAAPDLSRIFAGCTGRYSAEMEHAWLVNDPRADELQSQRLTFLSLLEATVPMRERRATLNYRIDVKLAHSALLTTASFSEDASRAAKARTMADAYLLSCNRLLLDS